MLNQKRRRKEKSLGGQKFEKPRKRHDGAAKKEDVDIEQEELKNEVVSGQVERGEGGKLMIRDTCGNDRQ
jgi:hypothetical protein